VNAKQLAAMITGAEIREEVSPNTTRQAKDAGLVIVFGASDDLMEFRGAIDDEVGAGSVTVDAQGLMPNFEDIEKHDKDGLRDYFKREGGGKAIEAVWDTDGYSWTYKTTIPHETFEVLEDGKPYCRGIVFRLADAST
jgi:hypothetical protein